ncbi:hypothetical protein, partial [Barnesiella sp. An55]|uniref:hypothetical protein n=1 Tax=Barnesiella sp. An55 TaxID=1965646 RepID=UPI001302983A
TTCEDPQKKHFLCHIYNNLHKDIKINALLRFHPEFCRLGLALQAISHEVEVGKMGGDSNKKRAFSQKLFLYRFSIGINFFKVKKIVLGY